MNIFARHLAISVATTPLKARELTLPVINSVGAIDTGTGTDAGTDVVSITPHKPAFPSSGTVSTISIVNPTYEKPISSIEADAPRLTDNTEKEAIDTKAITDEGADSEQTATIKPSDFIRKENTEIYTDAEIELISALKLRDAEVSAHERSHASAGGQYAGSPSYRYKTGPDGIQYAVAGEVSIDTSRIAGDPQATLQKAQQIKAAALAPTEPSAQDRKVAARADQMASVARSEILAASSGKEKENKSVDTRYETHVAEHFTGLQHHSVDSGLNNAIEKQMSARNTHIYHFYNSRSTITPLPMFDIQA